MGVGFGGAVKNVKKMSPPLFGSKIMNLLVFSIVSRKSVFGSRMHSQKTTTHNYNSSYAKQVWPVFMCFFTLFGYWVWGRGVFQGIGTTCLCNFSPY